MIFVAFESRIIKSEFFFVDAFFVAKNFGKEYFCSEKEEEGEEYYYAFRIA